MSDAVQSIHLHAIPLNLDVWGKAVAGLTAEQEGVLLRALRCAWNAGHRGAPSATLPADPSELARLLGTRNKRLHAVVRRFFVAHEHDATLLAWRWLSETYASALDRYERRKLAGVESGETRRRLAKQRRPAAAGKGAAREQCSNNVPVMFEQPKPNPVGVGLSDQPPTGGASTAPASGGRASPPEEPLRVAARVTPEQVASWRAEHPEATAELEAAADATMQALNADWRALPRRFGAQVRDDWLREQIARQVLADTGATHA